MLRELHISNLALIEDLRLELEAGLNCFTGQTGAGKSLVLGAFEILLGLRSAADMLRPGADEARVSGVFEIHDVEVAQQASMLLDQSIEPGSELLLTRKLSASGRSSVSINGLPATAAMARALGELLVDIHGQHDHQYLLKAANQLAILDAFGKCSGLRAQFADTTAQLRELIDRKSELAASRTLRMQQLELYEFQAQEIDAVNPQPGEFEQLKTAHSRLSNLKKIKSDASAAYAALYESDSAVIERLQMITHVVLELTELDPKLQELAEQVRTSTLSLQEAAYDLGRYTDRLDLDPGELAEVEERLNALNRLAAKYGGGPADDPLQAVLAYREQLDGEIAGLRSQNEDMVHLDEQIEQLRGQQGKIGQQLTQQRKQAAGRLKPLVEAQLQDLGMAEAQLELAFEAVPAESASSSGFEHVEMLVRTNPGQPARPLRKIASGGEMSRIMLALKAILAQHDRVSVLVFDEIDANIGGRMGTVIGQKLRGLARVGGSKKANHQVLCITHLPQIAAFADRHLRIEKTVIGRGAKAQTSTTVAELKDQARVRELADMLAGKQASDTTLKQAQEMLGLAQV